MGAVVVDVRFGCADELVPPNKDFEASGGGPAGVVEGLPNSKGLFGVVEPAAGAGLPKKPEVEGCVVEAEFEEPKRLVVVVLSFGCAKVQPDEGALLAAPKTLPVLLAAMFPKALVAEPPPKGFGEEVVVAVVFPNRPPVVAGLLAAGCPNSDPELLFAMT